jgi:hypothetical protein
MAPTKWKRRDEKLRKRKHGMRVSGRSIFTLQAVQKKKAESAKPSKTKKSASKKPRSKAK